MGKYDFPGGFVEYNENPLDACVREIAEETGLYIDRSALQLLTFYSEVYVPGISVVDLLFVGKDWTGEPVAADDSLALVWHPLDFVESSSFVPYYKGLRVTLQDYLATHV